MPTHWLCLTVKKSLITPLLINSMYKFLEILRYTIPRSYSTQVEIELFLKFSLIYKEEPSLKVIFFCHVSTA